MIWEIARVGDHDGVVLTKKDLKEVYNNFNPIDKAPITIGHPKSDKEPAYGWNNALFLNNAEDRIFSDVSLIPPLDKAYKDNHYRNRSSGLRKGMDGYYLHHTAILGAVPPKIKGLEHVNFSSQENKEDEIRINFSDKPEKKKGFLKQKLFKKKEKKTMALSAERQRKLIEDNKKLKQLEEENAKLKKENDDIREGYKNFSDQMTDQMNVFLENQKKDKIMKLKEACKGKVPEDRQKRLLEFADKSDGAILEFSDKSKHDLLDIMIDTMDSIIVSQPGNEEIFNFSDLEDEKDKNGEVNHCQESAKYM